MGIKEELQALREQIPSMECRSGCTDCCGPIPFAKVEWDEIADKRKPSKGDKCLDCPYSVKGYCEIYEDRPIICRLFGVVEDEPRLTCPYGCRPLFPLSKQQGDEITARYFDIMKRSHEAK